MSKQFAHCLAITARFDASRGKSVAQGMETEVLYAVARQKPVKELAVSPHLAATFLAADEICLRTVWAKSLQNRH